VVGAGIAQSVQRCAGPRDFSPLHSVQPGSETHPDFYVMGTGENFPGLKRLGHEADTIYFLKHAASTASKIRCLVPRCLSADIDP
jgi:hypothetical protein